MNTIILRGSGPAMRLSNGTSKPAKVLVVGKNKTHKVTINKTTNVKFAA